MLTAQDCQDPAHSGNSKKRSRNTSSDIKTAIELNLLSLEENCYKLAEKCEKNFPGVKKISSYAVLKI